MAVHLLERRSTQRCRTIYNNNRAGGGIFSNVPVGGIIAWNGSADNVPEGWALCDGENGTPDLRDKFVLCAGTAHTVGETGGEETHKLKTNEIPSHSHIITVSSNGNPGSSSALLKATSGSGSVYTDSSGGNLSHNNMPPYYTLCYIMKT